jgi:hypothetical protein
MTEPILYTLHEFVEALKEPTIIMEPVQDIPYPERRLFCDTCKAVKMHKRGRRGLDRVYVCECGAEIIHIILHKAEQS